MSNKLDIISSQNTNINSVSAIAHSIKTTLGLENNEIPKNAHSLLSGTKTNFEKVIETSTSFQGIDVSLYKSRETGLKVLLANLDVPITHGFFTLATEISNDSGCPHTLEHLIFLGSEQYPYKGMLDTIANRCFAQGTNAWTATDHTAYLISTVGQESFLQILPVYIDHILYATITSSGYLTEVHHISGEGKDAGVVYSEMQGRQNQSMDLMDLALQRSLFPEGWGYRSDTGGLMEALRILDVQTIRDYHANYYIPQNLSLVIIGNIDHAALLQTLQDQVESSILSKGKPDLLHWKRPWVTSPPVPSLKSSQEKVVEFPEEDESIGEYVLACFGPDVNDLLTITALDVLGEYLCDSAVSILSQTFIEIEDPVTTNISFSISYQLPCVCSICFESVSVEHLDTLEARIFQVFRKVESGGIDMERMKTVIEKERNKYLVNVERSPAMWFSRKLIIEALYGTLDGKTLKDDVRDLVYYDVISKWTSDEWIALLQRWWINNHHVSILGKPSAKLAKVLEKNEIVRIEEQRKKLGEEGLKSLKRKLEEAQEENDKPIPQELIRKFKVPKIESVKFIDCVNAVYCPRSSPSRQRRNEVEKYLDSDPSDNPINLVFSHTSTQFVTISLYITTKELPGELLPYLRIYLNSFFALPIIREGKVVDYEQVVSEVNRIAVDTSATLGVDEVSEVLTITICAEKSRYKEIVRLLSELFVQSVFDPERLSIEVSKAQNDIPTAKRDGDDMTRDVGNMIHLDEQTSSRRATTILRQEALLDELEKCFEKDEASVIAKFKALRAELIQVRRLRVNVIADVFALDKPVSVWEDFLPSAKPQPLLGIPLERDTLTPEGSHPDGKAYIVRLATQESTYLLASAPSISSIEHPDAAAMTVTLSWINMLEGYMWKRIRGAGLAYGAGIEADMRKGQVCFYVYRSPNGFAAWNEARKFITEISSGNITIDETELESAKSSHVYSVARSMGTNIEAAKMGYVTEFLKGLPKDYPMRLLKMTEDVTVQDCLRIVNTYLLKLFEVDSSDVVCVSAPTTVDEIAESFAKHKFRTEVRNLEDFQ